MKEKVKIDENNIETKKEKIFEVLNKKRKPETSIKDYINCPKKKMFILYKPNSDSKNQQNNIEKKLNENLINNLNNFNKNTTIQNNTSATPPYRNEQKIFTKIHKNENNCFDNKCNNNKYIKNNNNNYKNNININRKIINDDENDNNKITLLKKENQKEYDDYICYNDYQIGTGSFGEVLYGVKKNRSLEVAVKIINSDTSAETINKEIKFSKQLQKDSGFPIIYHTCEYDKKNIIVESLLGPSLDKLFKFCGKIFPLKTVCLIGKEMVKRLENMHEKGILHRDLKPNNLTWGNYNSSYNNISNYNSLNNDNYNYKLDINTIYLIDFGLSCSYWENGLTTKHYKLRNGLNFVGTLRYASLNSHKGIRQGRRDDLESMIYILIYFLKGKLPWQDIKVKQKEERHKLIFQIKSKVSIESLCQDLPSEFADLLKYVKSLKFDEKPIYCKFYAYFHNLITKLNNGKNEEKDFNFIWERMLVDSMNKCDENHNEESLHEAAKIIFKGYPINIRNYIKYVIYNNKNRK